MICAAPADPVRLVTVEALGAAERGLEQAAEQLVAERVDAIVVSIAPLVFLGGLGYDRVIIERIEAVTGLPTTTNQTAAIDALKALAVSRIALLNPNTSDLLARQVQFFVDSGIEVDVAKSLEIADNRDIDCVPRDVSYEFVRSAVSKERPPEGIYLSGPCWRTLDIIEPLESEFGIPVVSALQAMVWGAMRLVGRPIAVNGYGQLLAIP
jgi:maleate cis-trans isomerase